MLQVKRKIKKEELEIWWCAICIDNSEILVTDYFNRTELMHHYLTEHSKEQLADCIENMGNNPHLFDPSEDE